MLLHLAPILMLLQGEGADPSADGGGPSMMWPLIIMGAIFYFLLIAPERKQRKARQAMLDQLKKGDRVMTTGGMYGRVVTVEDNKVGVQVSDGVRLSFSRQAVQTVVGDDGQPLDPKKVEAPKDGAKNPDAKEAEAAESAGK